MSVSVSGSFSRALMLRLVMNELFQVAVVCRQVCLACLTATSAFEAVQVDLDLVKLIKA